MRADPRLIDVLVMVAMWIVFALLLAAFTLLVGETFWTGASRINLNFLTESPTSAGRKGGIAPILVSTLWILLVCLAASVLPLGVGTAVLLAEARDSRFTRFVRASLDVLAGVPSIVFGLFGNALFCKILGFGFSILSGGLTLACMVLPLLIRTCEEGLRAVPADYRLSAAALGLSRATTFSRILLPAAAPAIAVGLVLGIGRALAETAALIFTSGYVDRMPESVWDSGRALSLHVFDLAMNVPGADRNAHASALVLVVLLLVINGGVQMFSRGWSRSRVTT